MIRLLATLALTGMMLSACDIPAPLRSQEQADAQTVAACRTRANEVFDQQNRGTIFSQQSQVNMPYSANWTPDVPNRGLSQVFGFDRMVNDCVRNTGTSTSRTPTGSTAGITTPNGPTTGEKTAPPPPLARP